MTHELDERQLRLALENVPIPLIAHDETGRVRFLSVEFLRLTGYTAEQLPTFAAWLKLAYDDPAVTERVLSAHRQGYGAPPGPLHEGGEFHVRTADGSIRVWMFRAFSIGRDVSGLAVNVSMAIDVTNERKTLEALGHSEANLRQALRTGGLGSFERDVGARVSTYSDALLAMHGLSPERRRETHAQWFARVHPDDRAEVSAYVDAVSNADAPSAIEYRIQRLSDGETRRIAESREVQRDLEGVAVRCVGLQRDVTEARAAEQALRESEARLRLTLEVGQVGTFDWDLSTGVLDWDERVRDIWGVPADAPLTISDFYRGLHPDDVERMRDAIKVSLDPGGDGLYESEYRVVNLRDGRVRYISARGRTRFENGVAKQILGVALEVTALREAAAVLERDRDELENLVEARTRELAEAQTRLAQAQRLEALGHLAGGIAHDFNNVLQAIEAAADLIERKPQPENLPRYLRMAREATKRGSAISRRLLSFSRRAELEAEPVDCARLLGEIGGILRRTVGDRVTVRVECPAEIPPALADRQQLETALINIAANAREAMGSEGVLTLRARTETSEEAQASVYAAQLRPGSYIRFEVSDTGSGMAPEVRAHAVEPFFSTKPRGQGAGLGLSMARGFADQSGGGLKIDSEPGKGATIAIWLPVAEVAKIEPAARGHERGRRGCLLLVDDDPLVRELVGEQLREAGYDVTDCAGGAAAIDRLDAGLRFDALVTDFAMPEMNGVVLAHEARKRRPRLPVVVLTGYANEAAEAAGDADFELLRKPIDYHALVSRVSALIGTV
jgi:PAS domain S-box-containing protein